jgi:hypothetical protein
MMGCGGYGSLCADAMDCEGGNDADVDACEATFNYYEDRSSLEGCDPEWDDLLTCTEDEARCTNNVFSPQGYCDRERDRWVNCVNIGFNF